MQTSTVNILVPGLSDRFRTGGLLVLKDVAEIFANTLNVKVNFVATHEKCEGALSPEEAFGHGTLRPLPSALFIVSWGPLVSEHIKLIQSHAPKGRMVYYAQSFGWNIKVPAGIPIVCVSRYVMAQWALHATENPVAYIPPPLHECFSYSTGPRDIDILVHTRKQNSYCLNHLLPALEKKYNVKTIASWIPQEEFAALLKRTKIFLYVTELHKAGFFRRLPGEGFGLPALEAAACGALVGSNLLGGVTDFLTPGENCIKLQNGSLDFDLAQIAHVLAKFQPNEREAKKLPEAYSINAVAEKWKMFFASANI